MARCVGDSAQRADWRLTRRSGSAVSSNGVPEAAGSAASSAAVSKADSSINGFSLPPPPPPPPKKKEPHPYGRPVFECEPCTDADGHEEQKSEVRRKVLIPSLGGVYEVRDGQVRLDRACDAHSWTRDFGECGCSVCGCYRVARPLIRLCFRNIAVRRTLAQLAASGAPRAVRYVSVGCGSMLTDFEILCGLVELGCTVESVVVCDTAFPPGRTKDDESRAPLRSLARFFPSASVAAFQAIDQLQRAAHSDPDAYGFATTFVHCDASEISAEKARALAGRLLVAGGHYFNLTNNADSPKLANGSRRIYAGMASRACHVREPPAADAESPHKRWSDAFFAEQMRQVALGSEEGEAPICGARHLARILPGTRLYRVVAPSVPVHSGTAEAPHADARIVGSRRAGAEVLVDGWDGAWVRLSEHDPGELGDEEQEEQEEEEREEQDEPLSAEQQAAQAAYAERGSGGWHGAMSRLSMVKDGERTQPHAPPDEPRWLCADGAATGTGAALELVELS